MILNYKNILFLGILLFSILYSLLYILRDIYFATQNFQIKKYINKVLPFLTKYNIFFLIITLIILIIEFYNMYIPKFSFFIIIGCIILNFLLVYIPIRKIHSTKNLRLLSYILIIVIILIPIIYINTVMKL